MGWEVFFCKLQRNEHHCLTQSADVDTQVSLSPYHPSCKTQGVASVKHKESLMGDEDAQPTPVTQFPTVG